jgi:hypothetical protein
VTENDPIEALSPAVIDTTSIPIDWHPEGEYDSDSEPQWWEAESNEHTAWDATVHTVTLVFDRYGSPRALFLTDGTRIDRNEADEYGDYVYEHTNDDGNPLPGSLSKDDLAELFAVERDNVEGPRMNYWYPLQTDSGPYSASVVAGGGDHLDAAYRLREVPLVVTEVDGDYGLALGGGGMDMTWSILRAFVALGYLPPVHFARPPGFFEHDSALLMRAMRRSIEVYQQHLAFRLKEIARYEKQLLTEQVLAQLRQMRDAGPDYSTAHAKALAALDLALGAAGITLPEELGWTS